MILFFKRMTIYDFIFRTANLCYLRIKQFQCKFLLLALTVTHANIEKENIISLKN